VGRWFTAWLAVVVLGVALFVVGIARSSAIGDCTYDAGVAAYDDHGVPVQGACVASEDGDDDRAWELAVWTGGVLMVAGIVGSVVSALRYARRMVLGSFAAGVDTEALSARLDDVTDAFGAGGHPNGNGNGAGRPSPPPPPHGSTPPPRPWR
jgi:hypothetical protein